MTGLGVRSRGAVLNLLGETLDGVKWLMRAPDQMMIPYEIIRANIVRRTLCGHCGRKLHVHNSGKIEPLQVLRCACEPRYCALQFDQRLARTGLLASPNRSLDAKKTWRSAAKI